jgi:hypothetical protein
MAIDRSDFLILASTLAAGGAGGWFVRDRSPELRPAPAAAPVPVTKPSAGPPPWPSAVAVVDAKAASAPACDDSQGTPEACPSMGPADEGICANVIFKRCQEFRTAFKPRVATQAVACLRALKGNERCDPVRINQCGHMALMAACPEPAPTLKGQLSSVSDSAPPTVTLSVDPNAPAAPVATACESILKACSNQKAGPTLLDCRQTLAGLNDIGRTSMVDCASQHCVDRGLYLCEGVAKSPN